MLNRLKQLLNNQTRSLIKFLARLLEIDLFVLAIREQGILLSGNFEKTGEQYVVKNILPKYLTNSPIIFDVGANDGENSLLYLKEFSNSQIYAFEINPQVGKLFSRKFNNNSGITYIPYGLGANSQNTQLFSYKKLSDSQHGTVNARALQTLYGDTRSNKVITLKATVTTLDGFCKQMNIDRIDFLKIDTEGSEFDVIRGAKNMLNRNKIRLIQFEFNEFNIFSRIFMRDFYDILGTKYNLYRIKRGGLVPLKSYSSNYEIFKFQNILAINKNEDKEI